MSNNNNPSRIAYLSAMRIKLDENIAAAIKVRYDWYVENKDELAEFLPGDRIYAEIASNNYRLQIAGIVTEVYIASDHHDVTKPVICYRFTPDPSYHFGNNTEGSFSTFYTHDHWMAKKKAEISRLERSLK